MACGLENTRRYQRHTYALALTHSRNGINFRVVKYNREYVKPPQCMASFWWLLLFDYMWLGRCVYVLLCMSAHLHQIQMNIGWQTNEPPALSYVIIRGQFFSLSRRRCRRCRCWFVFFGLCVHFGKFNIKMNGFNPRTEYIDRLGRTMLNYNNSALRFLLFIDFPANLSCDIYGQTIGRIVFEIRCIII